MSFRTRALAIIRASVAASCLLLPQAGFTYEHPLSDSSVRNAYFLGQDAERATDFLAQYVQSLPVPENGAHVAQIELDTPYAQAVKASLQRPMGYSAQDAAADSKKRGDSIVVRVQVMLTPTYTGVGGDFWLDVSVGLVQKKHMAARRVYGVPLYASDRDGDDSWVIGANIFVEFAVEGVESDDVQVEVIPPKGPAVHATFDLSSCPKPTC